MPGQKILVICSFSEKETSLRLPAGFDISGAKLALCNYKGDSTKLRPYESRVYLWED